MDATLHGARILENDLRLQMEQTLLLLLVQWLLTLQCLLMHLDMTGQKDAKNLEI